MKIRIDDYKANVLQGLKLSKKLNKILLIILFFIILVFTRIYNLEHTARFIWDESIDLVRMHQFYVDRMVTLIGPIDETGTKVFGSITYYMLLPFAIAGDFDPVSPVYGAAFWGIITVLLLLYLTKMLNSKLVAYIAVLSLVWFPLLQTSRWARNPHLIIFWITVSLIFYLRDKWWTIFLSGLFLGLTFHHHYYSIYAVSVFTLIVNILYFRNKQLFKLLFFDLGILLAFLPFVIFDLRHPPGLFFQGFFREYGQRNDLIINQVSSHFVNNLQMVLQYYTQSLAITFVLAILSVGLIVNDIREKSRALIYFVPWFMQIFLCSFLKDTFDYYLLPGIIFFVIWIIYPRKNLAGLLQKMIIMTLILSGLLSVVPQLTAKTWETDIDSVRKISQILESEIKKDDLKNVSLAVLASPDNNIYGKRYRDLLLIDQISILPKEQYEIADNLFVISTSNEEIIRKDPVPEINNFRNGSLSQKWIIPNSPWIVYHLIRNSTGDNYR